MRNIFSIVSRRTSSVGAAAFILISMVLASRVLGLVRDRLLAARFDAGQLGIYFAAFRIPNLMFEILVMGALTSAFIPVFTKYIEQKKREQAIHMTATLINGSVLLLIILTIPILLWTDTFSRFIAPGFDRVQISQMSAFTRFMIVLQVVPLLIGNVFTGVLQSYNLFLIPAIAPVLYNLGIIAGIVALSSVVGLWAPVVGVGIGSLLFLLVQLPLVFSTGYRHAFTLDLKDAGVREVGKLMGPRALGLAVSQIDTTVDLMLASILGAKMVTVFNFAQHLQQFPVGLFGATIAQAALPTLARASISDELDQFKETILKAIRQILFFVLPAAVIFIVLRNPIVRIVFGGPRFDWEATVLTGMTLSLFSISLPAQAIVQVLARGFYALYDSKTPVIISVISILINTILSVLFISFMKLPVWSLGLSTSIASIVNALLLFIVLDRRVHRFSRQEFFIPFVKMIVASGCSALALYIPYKLFDQLTFDTTRTFGLILLVSVAIGIGLIVYMFLSWVLGIEEIVSCFSLFHRLRRVGVGLLEPAREIVNGDVRDKVS